MVEVFGMEKEVSILSRLGWVIFVCFGDGKSVICHNNKSVRQEGAGLRT